MHPLIRRLFLPNRKDEMDELLILIEKIDAATCPEDVFGSLEGTTLKAAYVQLAKVTHPDKHPDPQHAADAKCAFQSLNMWREKGEQKIYRGTYGDKSTHEEVKIMTDFGWFTVKHTIAEGDLTTLYQVDDDAAHTYRMQVVRNPSTNRKLDQAGKALVAIRAYHASNGDAMSELCDWHIPRVIGSSLLRTGGKNKHMLLTEALPMAGTYTFAEIMKVHTCVDPRDLAWMINRMLGALIQVHMAGYVHGAITPEHMLFDTTSHRGMLTGFCHSFKEGGDLKHIPTKYAALYPQDLISGDKPRRKMTAGDDIHMLARCFLDATFGGGHLPPPYAGMLRSCMLAPGRREESAHVVMKELAEILRQLYGERKFRVFDMPKPQDERK